VLFPGYSFFHQAVSELSAIGAPTRTLIVPLYLVYDLFTIMFGLGIWLHSQKRSLRITASLLIVNAATGFVGVPFPLQLGAVEATFTNTMHSILAGVNVILFLLAMGFGAFASGKRFRFYSFGTVLTLVVVGAVMGFVAGAKISAEGWTAPPQWFGLMERISIYGSMLWEAVLSIVLFRTEKGQAQSTAPMLE